MGMLRSRLLSLSWCRYGQCTLLRPCARPGKSSPSIVNKENNEELQIGASQLVLSPSQPEMKWQALKSATAETAPTHLSVTRCRHWNWITAETIQLAEKTKLARLSGTGNFRELRSRTTRSIRADRSAKWRAFAEEIERATACGDSRKLYQMVKQASRGAAGVSESLLSRDGAVTMNLSERLVRKKEQLEDLLNHPTNETGVDIVSSKEYGCNTSPPTLDEVQVTLT